MVYDIHVLVKETAQWPKPPRPPVPTAPPPIPEVIPSDRILRL